MIGVLPEAFWHLNAFTEVMAPLRAPTFPYLVRLRRGVTPDLAAERITSLVRSGVAVVPDGWRVALESAHGRYVQLLRPLLAALATATALVMLIACANVAVLFTVRATQRRREIAVSIDWSPKGDERQARRRHDYPQPGVVPEYFATGSTNRN